METATIEHAMILIRLWINTLLCAYFAALPAEARGFLGPHHVVRVLGTLTHGRPLGTEDIVVLASVRGTRLLDREVKRPHMDPFSCGPLLAFDDGAATVQALRVCCCIRVETEEQQGITLYRFNCTWKPEAARHQSKYAWWKVHA
jgi:hypothetical protein